MLAVALIGLALPACGALPAALPQPTPLPPIELPTSPPEPTAEPVAEPTPTAALVFQVGLPDSTLFDIAWDDRSIFAPGLTSAYQSALDERPGASVYHIDLTLTDDLTQVTGRQEVRYTNTEDAALDAITFRLFPNTFGGRSEATNVTVDAAPVEPGYELEDSALIVPLPAPLQPGEQVVIGMDFEVQVPTEPGPNYGAFALLDGVLALPHFYPMIAVYDDEGWNAEIAPTHGDVVYADSSYFLARVSAPAGQVVLGSGQEIAREEEDGRQVLTLAAGPVRDFYLVSSDRYEKLSEEVGETTIDAYAPPELAEANRRALAIAAQAFETYSERIGGYPFTQLDLAATPTLAGGIEYPGIVVVAEQIYDPDLPFFEAATAHEVAHQWFYSTVGNDQLDEPWLDESLTQFATWLYYEAAYGRAGYDGFRQSLSGRLDRASDPDMPIGLPVREYRDSDYSAIVYGRGPLFFEALRQEMGAKSFDAFLRDYYQRYRWDIATTEGLKALAEQHCNCDLTPMFEGWVYEK
jgi:hypothetical protein